jgi:hypothetical protein
MASVENDELTEPINAAQAIIHLMQSFLFLPTEN